MLDHPTGERLAQLHWFGMVHALTEQAHTPDLQALTFEERLGLLVDREFAERQNRQLANRLRQARLKQAAVAEDIDYRHPRGLDRAVVRRLLADDWVRAHQNVLITGPTGVGKTYVACALANASCRQGHDDWGLALLDDERRRDLLEILDERYQTRSTVVASQLPVAHWHEALGHPTLADAILDRLIHHAHPLALTGESLRKLQPTLTEEPIQE